ncbi:MAG: M6 family metalloprotease domain-containing protein [Phycisphaerae bacterium]|nr:M6 family metalloprotease domain-containing protein [Phycisphaerae bacterium]
MRSRIYLLIILLLPAIVFAAPYKGDEFELKQPDGSHVTVRVWGDEYFQHVESLEGYTLVRDKKNRWICYAGLSNDGTELVSTGEIYKHDKAEYKEPKGRQKHIRLPVNIRKQKALKVKRLLEQPPAAMPGDEAGAETQILAEFLAVLINTQIYGLTLLIDFPDEPNTISRSEIQNYVNQPGYTGYSNNGSVYDFFYDISNGNLEYTNYVTDYYTALHNKDYYTDENIAIGVRARELILEALNALEASGFDFSTLSVDSGNYILAINAFYAGAVDNAWSEGLWPHKSSMYSFTADGVKSGDYQITNIGTSLGLRAFCHENGHMICDWPDMYDYGYESKGLGNFCLMSSGGSNTNPVPPNPYLRDFCGWQTAIDIYGIGGLYNAVSNGFEMYRYVNSGNDREFFLIESILRTGRWSYCPDEGLAIWHIDKDGDNDNEQMTPTLHYMVSLEQADNDFDLENGSNYGDSTDLFGEAYNNSFSDITAPNAFWWDGSSSGLSIEDISGTGAAMSFDVVVIPTPPTAFDGNVQTSQDTPMTITLEAEDEGLPNQPGFLTYIIESLPLHGSLADANTGSIIEAVPYELAADAVVYTPCVYYDGNDVFTFTADDSGTPPAGGPSNIATVTISVEPQTEPQTLLSEDFEGGIPAEWTVVDGYGDGKTWMTDNPKNRPIGSYWTGKFCIVDSDWAGQVDMNEVLITPVIDCTSVSNLKLKFSHYFNRYSTEKCDVDVSVNNGHWQRILQYTGIPTFGNVIANISSLVDVNDQPNVRIRWHYYDANWEWYWGIDNIEVIGDVGLLPMAGDFGLDCRVDSLDLAQLTAVWLTDSSQPEWDDSFDLMPNNIVNFADLAVFAQNWLKTIEAQ